MKIYAERLVQVEVDRLCDVCGKSVLVEINGNKYQECGQLSADFGYGSKEDGNVYHLDLCESCFKVAIHALRGHRSAILNVDSPELNFGLNPDRSSMSFGKDHTELNEHAARDLAPLNTDIDTSGRIGIARNLLSVPDDIDVNNEAVAALLFQGTD